MEKFPNKSKIIETLRSPIEINIYPYIKDHQFIGRTVIPAVELCQLLAFNIKKIIPDIINNIIYNASFDKFIDVKDKDSINAYNDIEIYDDGSVVSKLLTKNKSEKSGITRTIEHVRLEFKKNDPQPFQELTYDIASALEGICIQIPADKVYENLVPFGHAYRNISGTMYVSDKGVIAGIGSPAYESHGPLGSPFVFDAAFHAASVWCQAYQSIVAFPTYFEKRAVLRPTSPNQQYSARIIPKQSEFNIFIFDIWIYDSQGNLCEAGFNIKLKDVNNGKLKPPDWIIHNNIDYLKGFSSKCDAISVIELNTITNSAEKALSDIELTRLEPMKERRRKTYIGARLACKYLTRKLSKEMQYIPADQITTIRDKIYPVCPMPDGSTQYNCSVSHDNRFAVAAASGKRIGIDVEEISETVLKAGRMYMSDKEKNLVDRSDLNKMEASLRIWSIKEAVTKALDLELSKSWDNVEVINIEKEASKFLINNVEIIAYHSNIDNHLFTLVGFNK
jgi:phosphopantetheinyl transferase